MWISVGLALFFVSICCAHEGSHDHSADLGFDEDFLKNISPDVRKEMIDNLLQKMEFVRNKDHVKEHMDGVADWDADTAEEQELEWNFFKLHDTDQNRKLDGLELLASMTHAMQYHLTKLIHSGLANEDLREKVSLMVLYMSMRVDKILEDEDLDDDGYLSYPEFAQARKKDGIVDV